MRKKRVVAIICLLLVVAIAVGIAWQFLYVDLPDVGDDVPNDNQQEIVDPVPVVPHEHDWSDWIETTSPTCIDVGQEQRVCECGEMQCRDITALGHSFSEWGLLLHPTCVEVGYEQRDCLLCGQSEMRELPALGHDFVDGYCSRCNEVDPNYDFSCKHENTSELVIFPTCTEDGIVNVSCSDCGSLLSSETIPATGHTFGEWTTLVASTCTTDGEQIRGCACGSIETQSILALGHDYIDGYCTRCGDVDPNYDFSCKHENTSGLILDPTCTEDGCVNISCSDCGELISNEVIPALGHDFVDGYCSRCGEIDPDYVYDIRLSVDVGSAPDSSYCMSLDATDAGSVLFASFSEEVYVLTLTCSDNLGKTLTLGSLNVFRASDCAFAVNRIFGYELTEGVEYHFQVVFTAYSDSTITYVSNFVDIVWNGSFYNFTASM